MILRRLDGKLLVIRQNDHAAQCGEFARSWRPLGAEPMPQTIVEATSRHDDGWIGWDSAPDLDPATGQPYPFYRMPLDAHLDLFREGIRQAVAVSPEVGLLVSLHGVGLYNGRYRLVDGFPARYVTEEERPQVEAFYQEQTALQEGLTDRLRATSSPLASDEAVWKAYRLLQFWDRLSLILLTGDPKSQTIGQVPWIDGDTAITLEPIDRWQVTLDPYPFDQPLLETTVPTRSLEDRRYSDEAEFRAAVLAARESQLTVIVKRP